MNSENISNHFSTKNFGKLQCKLVPAEVMDVMTFFFMFTCFSAKNWTSADMMILEEPVLLLRSENMVTLGLTKDIGAGGFGFYFFAGTGR